MNQKDRRKYLIKYLLQEQPRYADAEIPDSEDEQKRLLRSLMNVRMPAVISDDFRKIQEEYLTEVKLEKGIITTEDMDELQKDIFLWRGDITRISVGAIVNAANSGMTGCYHPCHNCIDNCIHTFAGIQLRDECAEMMEEQGREEETGSKEHDDESLRDVELTIGLGSGPTEIKNVCPNATVLEGLAVRGSSVSGSKADIESWISGLNLE